MKNIKLIAIFTLLMLYQLPLKTAIAMERLTPPQQSNKWALPDESFDDTAVPQSTEWGLPDETFDDTAVEQSTEWGLPDETFDDTAVEQSTEWGLPDEAFDDTTVEQSTEWSSPDETFNDTSVEEWATPQPEIPAPEAGNTPQESTENAGIGGEIIEGFSGRFNILAFGVTREPVTSSVLNQGNRQDISKYQAETDIRPDFSLDVRRIHLSVKPRWKLTYDKWTEGLNADDHETTDEFFVNEWLAQVMVTDTLFVSYGRENLQWGPSYLISPSNPFIKDNGRDNPKIEVSGLDYGRIIWIPHYNWSASLIANTDEGRQDFFNEFEKTYALKMDYTGYQKYFSLIPSYSESDEVNIGFFTGWSVSDALLLYGEGNVLTESGENDSTDPDLLLGTSYTFEMGPTFACEYFYQENGVTGPFHEAFPPLGTASPDDVLIRQQYGLLQLVDSNVMDHFNYVLRWIQNVDDHSSRGIAILEYEMGDHLKLFTIGDFFVGDTDDEFGSLNDYSVYLGFELTF